MDDLTSITTIIVNYRSSALVGGLLESMARRGGEGGLFGRVIVVDNASGDSSVETLRRKVADLGGASWVEVLDAGRNAGFGAGNNFGAAAALQEATKPDVLWFLNPDTLVEETDPRPALAWFESDPSVGIVGTGLVDPEGEPEVGGHRDPRPVSEFVRTGGALRVLQRWAVSDPALDRPGPVDWVSGASLMMRSSAFEQVGGFDEGFFLYFEEIDLCRRARRAGWNVVYEPRARIVHLEGRTTGVDARKPRPRYWYESRRRYFVKHFGVPGLLAADVAWGVGRAVGAIRRKGADACRLTDLWRCDGPVFLGRERVTGQGAV